MRYIWAFPLLTFCIGGVILLYGYWERREVTDEVVRLFERHVEAVASLVKEGAGEAVEATSLIYQLTEEHLHTTAHLLAVLYKTDWIDSDLLTDEQWCVKIIVKADGSYQGDFGPVDEPLRKVFIKRMRMAEEGEMVDDGIARRFKLNCLYHSIDDEVAIICRDAEKLDALRRETGIGSLMRGVVQRDVLYVALQDESGILAAAPSVQYLSVWSDDAELKRTLEDRKRTQVSRLRELKDLLIFEGLIPFAMADGTYTLLRVGVDARLLQVIQEKSYRRYAVMVILILSIILLVTSITWLFWRWKINQAEVERAQAIQEEERKHWEAISQMASTVAHEIRNPMNTISMVSHRLPREFTVVKDEQEEFSNLIGLLDSEAARVNRVVTEFLQLGKPLDIRLESIDAGQAVQDSVALMQVRAEQEGIDLRLDNRSDGVVLLDQDRFRQMMTNLIANAMDAVSSNGCVMVRSECSSEGLNVEIEDNGPGMEQEILQRVLDPFVSYKSKGTGLGLPLVKRLVEAHRGTLDLISSPGKGTTARIFIPYQIKKN